MSNLRPTPVDEWAPMFLSYGPASSPKFTKEQVLKPEFAITGEHCKLCDCHRKFWPEGETTKAHIKRHRDELNRWLDRRKREAAARSRAGLSASRRNKAEQRAAEEAAEIITDPDAYLEGGDDDDDE